MRFFSLISSLILSVFLLFISGSESVKILKHLTVRRGGSLSVPCLYDKKYKSHLKYWCKGYYWSSCGIVAKTNTSNTGISVTDYPSQNMFTVDLNNLKDSDSGWYWCAVEIGEIETVDDGYYVQLTVSADPAVRVENSRVSGQEGGSASVQGSYRPEYKNKVKWCRFKDGSCYKSGKTKTSQGSEVLVQEYFTGSFRVEMIGLQKSDAGWYWISAGDVGVTVHLTVTDRPTKTTAAGDNAVPTTQKTSPKAINNKTVESRKTAAAVNSATGSDKTEAPMNPPEETMTSGPEKPMESVEFCIAQN